MRIGEASECEIDTPSYDRTVEPCCDFPESRAVSSSEQHARTYIPGPRTIEVYTVSGFGIDTRMRRDVYVEREVYRFARL